MEEIERLKLDVSEGRIDPNRLLELIATLQRELQAAQQRIAELEKELGPRPEKLKEPFSLRAEEQRQEKRRPKKRQKPTAKKRRGRVTSADKIAQAKRREPIFPEGVPPERCSLSHVRPVWRLEQGRAILVAYEIYRGPNNQYGQIPGVLGRSEFSLEIVLAVAELVHVVKVSFDKACAILEFFQDLKLSKAQASRLLHQLARHWAKQFEILCTLLANSAVVYADETSWSLKSVWALLSEKARLLLFGVNKDAATLEKILDPETFLGILISDDAAVYANFTTAQKCWAHLLRKAIKLTLQAPDNQEYRDFTDRLLELYKKACRIQRDGRFSTAGRELQVAELEAELRALCAPQWFLDLPPQPAGVGNDYRLLVNELMRLLLAEELFTFVTAPPVELPNGNTQPVSGTNNESERTLRGAAEARKTGRTNKTYHGARRQTVLTSVLESLRLYLPTYTLKSVLAEVERWCRVGKSCFEELMEKLKLKIPDEKDYVLNRLIPTSG